jgi:hypothetical protein
MKYFLIYFSFFFWSQPLLAMDLSKYESLCRDIGFSKGTQKYGECVLELRAREKNNVRPKQVIGDGSADDQTCQRYGFLVGSSDYAQCRMQIDTVRNQASEQYRLSQERAEAERRAESRNLVIKGLGMIAGQPPQTFGGNQPSAPQMSPLRIFTLPNGRTMTCTTNGPFTNCH